MNPNDKLRPIFLLHDGTPTLSFISGQFIKEEVFSFLLAGPNRTPHSLLFGVSANFHFFHSFSIFRPCVNSKVAIHFFQFFLQFHDSKIVLIFFTILHFTVFFWKVELLHLDGRSTTIATDSRGEFELFQVRFEFELSVIKVVCTGKDHFRCNETTSAEVLLFFLVKFSCQQPN